MHFFLSNIILYFFKISSVVPGIQYAPEKNVAQLTFLGIFQRYAVFNAVKCRKK